MNVSFFTHTVFTYRFSFLWPYRQRKQGRPRTIWKDVIRRDLDTILPASACMDCGGSRGGSTGQKNLVSCPMSGSTTLNY